MEEIRDTLRLRDKRRPGHCWQDNELYDCFGPLIGPFALLVYVHMTRRAYGTETQIRASLRELAEACGVSKDTVSRAIGVMEMVGLIQRTDAKAVGAGVVIEYQLIDLKDLALRHGATFDPRQNSYVLSAAQASSLEVDVKEYLKGRHDGKVSRSKRSKTVSLGDTTVSLGDSSRSEGVSQGDTSVSLGDSSVLPGRHLSSYRKDIKQKQQQQQHVDEPANAAAANIDQVEILQAMLAIGVVSAAAVAELVRECRAREPDAATGDIVEAVGQMAAAIRKKPEGKLFNPVGLALKETPGLLTSVLAKRRAAEEAWERERPERERRAELLRAEKLARAKEQEREADEFEKDNPGYAAKLRRLAAWNRKGAEMGVTP